MTQQGLSKLILTLAIIGAVTALRWLIVVLVRMAARSERNHRILFWTRQGTARERLQRRYGVSLDKHDPRVFWRLTDNWLELTVRFVVPDHGIRELKDQIMRRVLRGFDAQGIEIGSTTLEISRVAPIHLEPLRQD